jgi:two-component system chemotaxis response regulator CheY
MNTEVTQKVIIADDSNALRVVLSSFFKELGYSVVSLLKDGVNVLQNVERYDADIVCLDYHMPKKDGLETLKDLHEQYPDVAVVMITGDENPEIHEIATELGADGFITKPFSQDQIAAEMKKVSSALYSIKRIRKNSFDHSTKVSDRTAVVVDDSETMRRLLQVILEDIGINVVGEGLNGQQAIDLVKEKVPDLLCMDIEMPVKDGISALAEIKGLYPEVQVIMITSLGDKKTVVDAIQKGASGYILKPYDPELVEKEIQKVLSDSTVDDIDSLFDPA